MRIVKILLQDLWNLLPLVNYYNIMCVYLVLLIHILFLKLGFIIPSRLHIKFCKHGANYVKEVKQQFHDYFSLCYV